MLGSSPHYRRAGTYETYAATAADSSRRRDRRRGTQQTCRCNAGHPRSTVALQARPRRPARARRHRRTPLPRRGALDPRRLPRGRGLLRYQRLPHHRAAARRVAPEGSYRPEDLLAQAREEAPPGALRVARGHPGLRRSLLARRGRGAARRRSGCHRVRDQLVSDLRPGVLLRGGQRSFAATTPLVARRRRTVLPDLAAGSGPWARYRGDAFAATAHADVRARRRGGIGGRHGTPLHARRGPVQDLLRDRHACYRVALWGGSRLLVLIGREVPSLRCPPSQARAWPRTVQAPLGMDGPTPARRRRPRRAGGPGLALPPPRRVQALPLHGRVRPRRARDGGCDHGRRSTVFVHGRAPSRVGPAALGGGPLLRHLPLALAGVHGDPP